MIINNDVKAMMAEALAEWIDGDVRMTRACAEALSMYIVHYVHIVSQQPAIPLGRQASIHLCYETYLLLSDRYKTLMNTVLPKCR